jgi:hypothetical protein
LFHNKRHPRQIEALLVHLAVELKVSASAQSQVNSVLLFLCKKSLFLELLWLEKVERQRLKNS